MNTHLFDNIFWHALSGAQKKFSAGTDRARRYAPGFSPIVGFPDVDHPDFEALRSFCNPGEHFYCDGWSGSAPRGWRIDAESTMYKMIWNEDAVADEAPDAIPLGSEHAEQALELATLTKPGPFGLRTIELGEYFGYFEGARLIAMAGERSGASTLREVSGVCTHPEYQGRGLARRLMTKLIHRQMRREQLSFLHVMSANSVAHDFYLRMGFRDYKESVVRVITPL